MTLQKRKARKQIPPRIRNYSSSPAQYNLQVYTIIPSHRLYETVIALSGYQREEGRTKRQIQIQLNVSRMKKDDPTNATDLKYLKDWTISVQGIHVVSSAYRQYTVELNMRKKDPCLMNAFQRRNAGNFKLDDHSEQGTSCYKQDEKKQGVDATKNLLF